MHTLINDSGATTATLDIESNHLPMTILANGLAGAETVDVSISYDGGTNYTDVYEDGVQLQLTPTNTAISLIAPGRYKFTKGVTAGTVVCGAAVHKNI